MYCHKGGRDIMDVEAMSRWCQVSISGWKDVFGESGEKTGVENQSRAMLWKASCLRWWICALSSSTSFLPWLILICLPESALGPICFPYPSASWWRGACICSEPLVNFSMRQMVYFYFQTLPDPPEFFILSPWGFIASAATHTMWQMSLENKFQ